MKKFITMLIRHWVKNPVKILMTIAAVALGTGILIISFSAGSVLQSEVLAKMNESGVILYGANGEWATDGSLEQERPGQFDQKVFETLVSEGMTITVAAIVMGVPVDEITVEGKTWQLRSSVGTDPSYFDVFGLEIIAGAPMTEEVYASGLKKVWISETTALMLFGKAENAIGKRIAPPGMQFMRGPGGSGSRDLITQYSVAGVFADPQEVARRSYGIADVIFPVTAMMPNSDFASRMLDFMSGQFVVKSTSTSVEKVQAEIASIIENNYGYDVSLVSWEGSLNGESTYMEELRQAVSIFTVSVNILGIVLLLTSSLGIFSIMVVESLGRRREIALERSLGASQVRVIREFWSWSMMLSLLGAVIGVLLALAIGKPVLGTLSPLLGELSSDFSSAAGVKFLPLVSGFALAIGCGGLLGLLPAFSAVKGNIAETLREV
ncbi:ABC transporter permease [Spirochaeta isovalerica]|uniref:ABC-type antimicrobial peptide transport system permease subunit n=1 Tax=Spirochaeta isovalerica TaxID=150 RepID=A0A841R4W5_9SPIO|nr:ABC transporter permease [Spirochaeta isovalerica]MBB6478856.1 ABC-type antimicrobial peptide transport system permease subunit [Spirochaeta isovalerica]